jgi:ABC-2 type transport system ATP-binding protein
MAAIELLELVKDYEVGFWRKARKRGLNGLSLTVEDGEIFGCLGPNGAGKTTTLKILMGLTFPTSGTAKILGKDIDHPEVKRQIGFLPEQPYFYDYLTAMELLEYYAALSGVAAKHRRARADAMLARVGLADAANTQLRKFSKGMLQRVGIAQAIVHDPKIVFLDEPMSGLDPVGRREVRDLIQELNDHGTTVFFSTHILNDAETLCDRVAVLHKGELRGVEVVDDLLAVARGKVEITWQGVTEIASIRARSSKYRTTGETVRAVINDAGTDRTIDEIRAAGARLLSITPVHGTLEDYFLRKIEARGTRAAQEVTP